MQHFGLGADSRQLGLGVVLLKNKNLIRSCTSACKPAFFIFQFFLLRALDLAKLPGVAETIDWANAVAFLGVDGLDEDTAVATLGAVLKDHDDQQLVVPHLAEVVGDGDAREPVGDGDHA